MSQFCSVCYAKGVDSRNLCAYCGIWTHPVTFVDSKEDGSVPPVSQTEPVVCATLPATKEKSVLDNDEEGSPVLCKPKKKPMKTMEQKEEKKNKKHRVQECFGLCIQSV